MKILLLLQNLQLYIVLGVYNTYTSNDLASHIHSQYASTDHTHSNYVTSDQVSTIVNSSIESGEIVVSSGGFTGSVVKSGRSFTYTGSGVLIPINYYELVYKDYALITIDGSSSKTISCYSDMGIVLIPFTSSIKMEYVDNSYSSRYVEALIFYY